MKLSLLLALIGAVVFIYGWTTTPPMLSLMELLPMETSLQEAYFDDVNKATILRLGGCVLTGIGLVSFVVIRSIKIHKKV